MFLLLLLLCFCSVFSAFPLSSLLFSLSSLSVFFCLPILSFFFLSVFFFLPILCFFFLSVFFFLSMLSFFFLPTILFLSSYFSSSFYLLFFLLQFHRILFISNFNWNVFMGIFAFVISSKCLKSSILEKHYC